MALFRRSLDPELKALQDSIRSRGDADRVGAQARTDSLVMEAVTRSGAPATDEVQAWANDRLRVFVAQGTVGWMNLLMKLPDDYPQLKAEFFTLVSKPKQFGVYDLVAWWWNLQPTLFKPLLENQFAEMAGPLAYGIRAAVARPEPLPEQMFDWDSFGE